MTHGTKPNTISRVIFSANYVAKEGTKGGTKEGAKVGANLGALKKCKFTPSLAPDFPTQLGKNLHLKRALK